MNEWLVTRKRPLIIGHRGASAHAPENTLAAFRLARQQGADGIDLDVTRCLSGQIVVIHDDTLNRTTNGDGNVNEWALSELLSLDAGKGERIPTLDEVFETVGPHLLINVEVKNPTTRNSGVEAAVVEVVRRHNMAGRVLFSCFNP